MPERGVPEGVRYAPRPAGTLPLWDVAGLRLKPAWIATDGAAPEPGQIAAARAYAARALPQAVAAEGGASGLGYAVLHRGMQGVWLLLCWWAHDDICCLRVARAEADGMPFEDASSRPLMACVWEGAVIEHERLAWIGTMMTGAPDAEAYLARAYPAASA